MTSPLESGTKLGRYEIRSRLATGGMGEVYLAFDRGLDRRAALKILPEAVASNPQTMQRFVLEAKAASALNHPNIITIYEIGTESGSHFIATEFIDGETLRRYMSRSELSIAKAIDIALQVASALSTAHAAGIIHRDIKPENIMLRRDGIVKVLDFGLAKLTERWHPAETDADGATKATIFQTHPGMIVGTTAYMSPEQTRTAEVDTRTDIWSLGVVLYEMLAGRTPFKGDTPSDTSAAILRTDPPPLSLYFPEVPPELERIVKKALQKDRDERYQVVKDFELDLRSLKRDLDLHPSRESAGRVASHSGSNERARPTDSPTLASTKIVTINQSTRRWSWVWLGLLGLCLLAGFIWWRLRPTTESLQPSHLTVTQLVSRKNDLGDTSTHGRFSPDGKFIAYSATKDGVSLIWLRQVSGGEPFTTGNLSLTATSPVWSPDGQQIAFLSRRDSQSGIWTRAAFGGAPTLVKSLEGSSQGLVVWAKSGTIYFVAQGNLYAIDVNTKQTSEVVKLVTSRPVDRNYSVSPDEQSIAYSDIQNGQRDIWVVPRGGGQSGQITNDKEEDSRPVWTPDGKNIVYSSKRNGIKQIFLAYLDGRPPVQLTLNDSNSDVLDISPDGGRVLYATAGEKSDLWSVTLERPRESQLTSDVGVEIWPDVSPNGNTIAFQSAPVSSGVTPFRCLLMTRSLSAEATPTQLAPDGFAPQWSPDGKKLAFLRDKDGQQNLWIVSAAGGDAKQLTTEGVSFGGFTYLPYNRQQTRDFQWSADGAYLLYASTSGGVANIWQIAADGSQAKRLSDNTNTGVRFFDPMWSPGGDRIAWLAMATNEPKRIGWSVWLYSEGQSRQIYSTEGSVLDLVGWDSSRDEIIVKSALGSSTAPALPVNVDLSAIPAKGGKPRPLFEVKAAYFQNIQMSTAGNQIAFITRDEGSDSLRLASISNGAVRSLITSNDSRVYLAGLAWAKNGKAIYYAKQESWTILSMIENFKTQ